MNCLEEFAADLADICTRSPVAAGRPLRWTIIANPTAGGFTIRSRWKRHRETLSRFAEEARAKPPRQGGAEPSLTARSEDGGDGSLGALGLVPTRRAAHAGEIVRALVDEAASFDPTLGEAGRAPFYLIVTAGGDGTSLEALTALFEAPAQIRSSFAILRLPMGTGNDGADGRELADALDLIAKPSRIEYARAVRLCTATAGKGPFLAFNILSVGIDAFVTHMTNKMKGRLPGDSYKLWVDLASLCYDKVYKVAPMTVNVTGPDGRTVMAFTEELLLLAVGATGNRTYGSNKRILPDDRNACTVSQMPLIKKLQLKGLFTSGRHADRPEARLFNAQRVEFRYEYPILAQMDGEAVRLEPADFPASIELTEPAIPILKPA
jgi:diacylglycerol kinase family enzyme